MTRLVSAAECQALGIGADLPTATLEAAIDREEAELVKRFDTATGSRTETLDGACGVVFLRRQISAVSAVTEASALGETPTALTTTDYYAESLEGILIRLPEGRLWGRRVAVTYTPVDDTPLRTAVLFELIRIGTEQAGWGDGSQVSALGASIKGGVTTGKEWSDQRAAQYARMGGLVP